VLVDVLMYVFASISVRARIARRIQQQQIAKQKVLALVFAFGFGFGLWP